MKPFDYHESTKHSYYSVRSNPNRIDWDNPPNRFKSYETFEKIPLNITLPTHKFIMLSFGITAKKSYPGMEYFLRINPSAGALYPNEMYFQVRNQEGFINGIYHYNVLHNHVVLLHEIFDDGLEPYFGYDKRQNGFIFLVSSVYYRSSWKYKNRGFRYCLLDAGHLLGCMEASAYVLNKTYTIQYDFDKSSLNTMFGFEHQEFFTASFHMVFPTSKAVDTTHFTLPFCTATEVFEQNKLIEFAYEQSKSIHPNPCAKQPSFNFSKSIYEQTIKDRRSIRGFTAQWMKKFELETILKVLNQAIPSDCNDGVSIYYVVNRIHEMPLGLYHNEQCIKEGDFSKKAGYLCLEQELGATSAVTFFLTSKAKNYQALYQKAGVIGHRLYLSANYLGYGCSGIGAYYDDEVNAFLGQDQMVLYALAIGN